jgi:hypothetical protein
MADPTTYYVDSHMGGTFTVVIDEAAGLNLDQVRVRVTTPGWEKHSFWVKPGDLIEDAEIARLVVYGKWRQVAQYSTHSERGEAARKALATQFGPLTPLQEEVLLKIRTQIEAFNLADSIEQSWRMGRLAYVDARQPIPGLRRKFDRANKEALTRIGERVLKEGA